MFSCIIMLFGSNSNAFSLIICKVCTRREKSDRWNSGPEKAPSGYLFCTTPNDLKLHEDFLWNILKILEQITTAGGPGVSNTHLAATGPLAWPGRCCSAQPSSGPPFWYVSLSDLEKK
jgi:hypothetical protein